MEKILIYTCDIWHNVKFVNIGVANSKKNAIKMVRRFLKGLEGNIRLSKYDIEMLESYNQTQGLSNNEADFEIQFESLPYNKL